MHFQVRNIYYINALKIMIKTLWKRFFWQFLMSCLKRTHNSKSPKQNVFRHMVQKLPKWLKNCQIWQNWTVTIRPCFLPKCHLFVLVDQLSQTANIVTSFKPCKNTNKFSSVKFCISLVFIILIFNIYYNFKQCLQFHQN